MANIIIGIHGLGNKPPKPLLEHWWKLAMIEGLKTNNFNPALLRRKIYKSFCKFPGGRS